MCLAQEETLQITSDIAAYSFFKLTSFLGLVFQLGLQCFEWFCMCISNIFDFLLCRFHSQNPFLSDLLNPLGHFCLKKGQPHAPLAFVFERSMCFMHRLEECLRKGHSCFAFCALHPFSFIALGVARVACLFTLALLQLVSSLKPVGSVLSGNIPLSMAHHGAIHSLLICIHRSSVRYAAGRNTRSQNTAVTTLLPGACAARFSV